MNSLFVCHSTGDTKALIATANALIKNSDHKVVALMIGNAAIKQWEALAINSPNLIFEAIPESFMQESETGPLSKEKFETIKKDFLDKLIEEHKITNALVGTPSLNQSSLAFQITEHLTYRFDNKHLFVYNDYLFKEKAHCYWKMLDENWAQGITHLVPLPATQETIHKRNPLLKVDIVGHPAIDAALSEVPINKGVIREALAVKDTQSLIYISGSKDLSQDKELLEVLFQTLEKDPNPELELRLGIHPGVTDGDAYITGVLKVIAQFPVISQSIKLLAKSTLTNQLTLAKDNPLYKNTILPSSLSSDDLAQVADGIVSVLPATLFNTAVLQGKPAYCHEEANTSYLSSNQAFTGQDKLPAFFSAVKKKAEPQPISQSELGLTEQTFVQVMSDKLMSDELSAKKLSFTPS